MLACVAAVGSGLARTLRGRIDAGSQFALAPILGFALSIGILSTLDFFVPLQHAFWFALMPLALISLVFAFRGDARPRNWRPQRGVLLQLAVVIVGVLAILNAPLVKRDSAGPIAWGIYDAPGYTDCIAAFQSHTTDDSVMGKIPDNWWQPSYDAEAWKPTWNLGLRYCWAYRYQHESSMVLPAAISGGLGWWPWETLAPFMAFCVLLAALGAFTLFRLIARSRTWLAVVPGLAMAGAPLFQLYIDGSAGLLAGIALIPALLAVTMIAFRRLDWVPTLIAGVLLGGLIVAYPEMGVVVAGTGAIGLLGMLVLGLRRGRKLGEMVRPTVPYILGAIAMGVIVAPRATLYAITNLSEAGTYTKQVIDYQMQIGHLPGWLLQTREFYTFALSDPHGFAYLMVGIVLPLLMIAVGLYGCWRHRASAWIVLLFILMACLQGIYSATSLSCSYCVGRTLLTIVPSAAVLVTLGVYELVESVDRRTMAVGVAIGTAALIAAGASLFQIEQRTVQGAYMSTADLGKMAAAAEGDVHGTVELEGFGMTPLWAWGENRTTYQAMEEATGERISLDSAYNDWGGLSYYNTHPPPHPSYDPDYKYVLTRLTGLTTGRKVIARFGTLRLEHRLTPFDVTVARGVAVETYERDPGGAVWVQRPGEELGLTQGALTFWVSALSDRASYLRAEFQGPTDLRPKGVPGAVTYNNPDGRTKICMPVPGGKGLRIAKMPIEPEPEPVTAPFSGAFGSATLPDENASIVAKEIQLLGMHATTEPCR